MISEGNTSVVKTHSITEIEQNDDEIDKTVKQLNSLGTYRDVKQYIKELAVNEEYEYLLKYIQPIECYDDTRIIITTHKKFLNASKEFLENYEIIIDEDILLSSAKNTVSVLIEDLEKISEYYKARHILKTLKEGEYINSNFEDTYIDFETISKRNISTNVNAFMKYKHRCNGCKIHFGNTEGCDYMKGENLLIIGTPHMNEFVYKLLAVHIGVPVNEKMRHQEISNEHYKFWFNTYDNEGLRRIQLWFIHSELEQATGRARLLRFNCTVKLFANLPLEQAEII